MTDEEQTELTTERTDAGRARNISDEGGGAFTSPSAAHIPGYRKLSGEELDLIAESKQLEAKFNSFVDKLRAAEGVDQRNVSIAATAGEEAFMRAVRAVAQPERLTA